ncbi:MAG: NADH-quinone oxidoreductase subunit C [Actinomycetota bacterium]
MAPADLLTALRGVLGDEAVVGLVEYGQLTATVDRGLWIEAVRSCRGEPALGFDFFDFLTAVDLLEEGFAVVLHLYSTPNAHHLNLRCVVPREDARLPSVSEVYAGADWHERETWEMFGVVFEGHPNLVHIELPDNFEGHPLRKEFHLASRVAKPWPGEKEPSERHAGERETPDLQTGQKEFSEGDAGQEEPPERPAGDKP